MKLKNKLILGASALLVLSGAAAGTGTYAWFTANRQVNLNVANISAKSYLTSLTVDLVTDAKNTHSKKENADTGDSITLETTKHVTDVSGYGDSALTYAKPLWDETGLAENDNIVGWASAPASSATVQWFYYFKLSFTVTGTNPVALYLDPTTTISAGSGDNLGITKALRFSVIDGVTSGAQKWYCAPNSTDSAFSYSTKDTTTHATVDNTAATVNDVKTDIAVTSTLVLSKTATTGFFAKTEAYTANDLDKKADATNNYKKVGGYLTDLDPTSTDGGETHNYIFAFWLEGSDFTKKFTGNETVFSDAGLDINLKLSTVQLSDIKTSA